MSFFYILSKNPSTPINEYLFGFTSLSFEVFKTHKTESIIHLFISCSNKEQFMGNLEENNLKCDQFEKHDLKKLILFCMEKIQLFNENEILPEPPVPVVNDNNIDGMDRQRLSFLENINIKISEENQQVSHILNRLQVFKTNILRANQNLDSLRKYKNQMNEPPPVFQSERPRGNSDLNETITIEECKLWMKNKLVNPKSGRKIDQNGPTYKKFQSMVKLYKLC